MKKLRLLMCNECNRNCNGCCNKGWDLDRLPVCLNFIGYDLIMLTGGEPMLRPNVVKYAIEVIREVNPHAKIIMYTAYRQDPMAVVHMLDRLDGITITLHEQEDLEPFLNLCELIVSTGRKEKFAGKSLRLNVFSNVKIDKMIDGWEVKDNIQWIKNCPLPEGETFMRFCKEDELDWMF